MGVRPLTPLQELQRAAGVSQQELARALGVSQASVHRMLVGRKPVEPYVVDLAAALGVGVERVRAAAASG